MGFGPFKMVKKILLIVLYLGIYSMIGYLLNTESYVNVKIEKKNLLAY